MKSVAICAEGLSNLACDAANHMRVLQSDGVIDQLLRALRGVDETDPARGETAQLHASIHMQCTPQVPMVKRVSVCKRPHVTVARSQILKFISDSQDEGHTD